MHNWPFLLHLTTRIRRSCGPPLSLARVFSTLPFFGKEKIRFAKTLGKCFRINVFEHATLTVAEQSVLLSPSGATVSVSHPKVANLTANSQPLTSAFTCVNAVSEAGYMAEPLCYLRSHSPEGSVQPDDEHAVLAPSHADPTVNPAVCPPSLQSHQVVQRFRYRTVPLLASPWIRLLPALTQRANRAIWLI